MDRQKKTQEEKFKQAARDLETDNDKNRFDNLLGKIAKAEKPKIKKSAKQD